MILPKKYLRSYIRKLIENASAYDSTHGWNASDDSDWPSPTGSPFVSALRSRNAIFIDQPEEYFQKDLSQMSHGGYSHALKHAYELDPENVLGILKKIANYIKNLSSRGRKLFKVSKRTGVHQSVNSNSIKPGDVLNTLDWINDSMYYGVKLPTHYQRIYTMSSQIYDTYWNNIRNTRAKAIDVSDEIFPNINDLIDFLRSKPVIMFRASFKDKEPSLRILDTSNSVLFGSTPDGKISTYFMQEKRPHRQSLIRSLYFISPIRKDGNPSATMVTDEYSNLKKIAAMAVRGEL